MLAVFLIGCADKVPHSLMDEKLENWREIAVMEMLWGKPAVVKFFRPSDLLYKDPDIGLALERATQKTASEFQGGGYAVLVEKMPKVI